MLWKEDNRRDHRYGTLAPLRRAWVDTHARTHTFAILVAGTGELIATEQFLATGLWVIEGDATYGARLAAAVSRAGYEVVEAARMDARAHRGTGKSDSLDAHRIAAAVLPLEPHKLRRPRGDDGIRAAVRILVTAREHMTSERTATINALLRVVDLGIDARKPLTARQVGEVARWRTRSEDLATTTARAEAIRLAKRVVDLDEEIAANQARIAGLIRDSSAAVLLDKVGIGPVTVAVVYAAWSHSGRDRSEAAFAALAGVNPIPASSGNTTRHRLNRGGDRRLNSALHMAVITRMTQDPPMSSAAAPKDVPPRRSDVVSSGTSPDSSTAALSHCTPSRTTILRPLDET